MRKVVIHIEFNVDEENQGGVRKFHDTVSGFAHQLKQDFNGQVQEFDGQISFPDEAEVQKALGALI